MRKQFSIVPVCVVSKKVASIKKKEGLQMTKESSRCQKAWGAGRDAREKEEQIYGGRREEGKGEGWRWFCEIPFLFAQRCIRLILSHL